MSKNQTKAKIINTAIELFSTKGFDKTTAKLIANECDISQANVFYHFKNKMVLFEGTVDFIIANNKEVFEMYEHSEKELPFDRLIRLLDSNIRWAYKFPQQAKIILMLFNFSTWDENFMNLSTATIERGKNSVLSLLEEINVTEPLTTKMSHEKLAYIIQQYVNAVVFQLIAHKERAKIKKQFKRDLSLFMKELLYSN